LFVLIFLYNKSCTDNLSLLLSIASHFIPLQFSMPIVLQAIELCVIKDYEIKLECASSYKVVAS